MEMILDKIQNKLIDENEFNDQNILSTNVLSPFLNESHEDEFQAITELDRNENEFMINEWLLSEENQFETTNSYSDFKSFDSFVDNSSFQISKSIENSTNELVHSLLELLINQLASF